MPNAIQSNYFKGIKLSQLVSYVPFIDLPVPRVAPTDFALKPDRTGTALIATWKAPDPATVNGRITFYTIKYRQVGSVLEKTTGRIGVSWKKGLWCPFQ